MPKVYTQFDRPKTIPTPAGDRFLDVFQEKINKDGSKEIVKTGVTNVYELIQSEREASKIENILHSVAMGDLNVLNQREGFYIDATEYPKTLMEAQNLVIKAENHFNEMPDDFREKFHNNPREYMEKIGTPEYEGIINDYFGIKEAKTEKIVPETTKINTEVKTE